MRTPLQAGALFAGRYRVVRPIAEGGMGAVFEVVHEETGRARALKVMLPHLFEQPDLLARFQREARVTSQIESKFIVDVVDAGIDGETSMPFLVMELLPGEDLGQRLKRTGPPPPEEAIVYLHQAALALEKTQRAGIIHRDLKPSNLFLVERDDEARHIKILDFGIAKVLAEGQTSGTTDLTAGSPLYMAPEQIESSKVSPAADIYALGMIAYTLLVGQAYWAEDLRSAGDLVSFARIRRDGPREPASDRARRRGVTLPDGFDPWFAKVTARSPSARFPTAGAAIDVLAQLLGVSLPVPGADPHGARGAAVPDAPSPDPTARTTLEACRRQETAPTEAMPHAVVHTPPLPPRRRAPVAIALCLVAAATAGLIYWSGAPSAPAPASAPSAGEGARISPARAR